MPNTYVPPTISVLYDLDEDAHILVATGRGGTAIAGERILRAEPWPSIRWKHDSAESAEADAATLRAYLAECASGKRVEKEDAPVKRGWWQD